MAMKMRQFAVVWIAGIMMGTGGGLIIARSLPVSGSATGAPVSQVQGNSPAAAYSSLFDPQQLPAFPLELPGTRSGLELKNTSSPNEPRLLPQGEATPVKPQPQASGLGPSASQVQPEDPATRLSGFRQELQDLAPELNEEALNELERIRRTIESGEADLASPPSETTAEEL